MPENGFGTAQQIKAAFALPTVTNFLLIPVSGNNTNYIDLSFTSLTLNVGDMVHILSATTSGGAAVFGTSGPVGSYAVIDVQFDGTHERAILQNATPGTINTGGATLNCTGFVTSGGATQDTLLQPWGGAQNAGGNGGANSLGNHRVFQLRR